MRRRVILDVDTGSDDAVAICMAALHPDIELVGCTTVAGNLTVQQTTENTLRVLDAIGCGDVEVHAGLSRPFAPRPYPPEVGFSVEVFHQASFPFGSDGLRPSGERAVEWLIETLRAATQPVTLVPTAPLSNIAAALTVAPDILGAVDEIVMMGGASKGGNCTASAEFNVYSDAVAADVVLQAGVPRLTMVSIDATHEVLVSRKDLERYRDLGTRAGALVAGIGEYYIDGYDSTTPMGGGSAAPLHDAVCLAYAIDPRVLDLVEVYVEVDTVSPRNYGRTTVDFQGFLERPPNVRFATHADSARFHRILDECLRVEAGG
jgi:purine nucleosidase/ribosylpyrimidine nucleosidase